MATLKEILEKVAPAQRYIFTAKEKPRKYITFQTIIDQAAISADDETKMQQCTYRVTYFCKDDYEAGLKKIIRELKAAGYYIQDISGETYETDTGYWVVPINIQELKE